VLQFYPETEGQSATVMAEAKKAGFGGGIVVDYPESKKARKYYLCLVAGSMNASTFSTPLGLQEETDQKFKRQKDRNDKKTETRKEFIIQKKELYGKRGKEGVPCDSKHSGKKGELNFKSSTLDDCITPDSGVGLPRLIFLPHVRTDTCISLASTAHC